jgi:transcriptional regulator with XRE-family HTH domain
MEDAGQKLKRARERLRLTYREVEEASVRIAQTRGNDEFIVALSRLSDIENKGTLPTLYRLYSLCAVYRLEVGEVLSWYGIPMETLPGDAGMIQLSSTHLVGLRAAEGNLQAPLQLDPGIDLTKTVFLSRMIQRWGKLPLMLLNNLDLKNYRYGLIGTEDWYMHPILRPGSLVVIDETRRRVVSSGWSTEFERPIYFLEHRGGYACSWCVLKDGRLTLQPHPSSSCDPETYDHPAEIEIIGQVTAVAMSIDPAPRRRPPG